MIAVIGLGPAAFVAAAVAVGAAAPVPVRAQPRPDVPWVVAVVAVADDVKPDALVDRADPSLRALVDAGGAVAVDESAAPALLVVVEGPPDADAAVLAAARAVAGRRRAAIFVDGRTRATSTGTLSPPPAAGAKLVGLPLAPAPGLFDVEGAALALFVDDAVAGAGAHVVAAPGRAVLVAAVPSSAKAALEEAVAVPLSAKQVEALRTRAAGVVAARRSRVGGWARDAALMWLTTGTLDVEEPADLGPRLRARIFPALLAR